MRRILYLFGLWLTVSSFTTIHLMGDSTMADKDLSDGKPERGWGMQFPNFVDRTLHVVNYAQNGRSTKSFIDNGLWDKVYNALQPGDYVFIEFGHNDSKADDPRRYAPAFGAYQDNRSKSASMKRFLLSLTKPPLTAYANFQRNYIAFFP